MKPINTSELAGKLIPPKEFNLHEQLIKGSLSLPEMAMELKWEGLNKAEILHALNAGIKGVKEQKRKGLIVGLLLLVIAVVVMITIPNSEFILLKALKGIVMLYNSNSIPDYDYVSSSDITQV